MNTIIKIFIKFKFIIPDLGSLARNETPHSFISYCLTIFQSYILIYTHTHNI